MAEMYFDAYAHVDAKPDRHPAYPCTLEALIAQMRYCSISAALVTSLKCVDYDPMYENLRLSERLAEHEGLFPLWNAMPHWTGEFPEPNQFTRLMRENDVRAVTIHPVSNSWDVLARSSAPLLKEFERTRCLVITSPREVPFDQVEQLLEQYPALSMLYHGVSWSSTRRLVPLLLAYKNLHVSFDTLQINYGLEWLVEQGCEEQLVFASNATDMSPGAHRAYGDYAAISDAQRAKFASGNLIRLLNGQRPPRTIENHDEDEIMAAARRGEPLTDLVIDFHTHILDEGLDGVGRHYTMWRGGPAGTLALAERMGVNAMGMMSWAGPVCGHIDEGMQTLRDALDALPESYWGLATLHPTRYSPEQTREALERIFQDPRFLGLKPYPSHGVHYDDPRYEPWWCFGNERKLYALLHPCRSDMSEFENLCPKYPDLTFVAAHCGRSYTVADHAIRVGQQCPNFFAEITFTSTCMGIIEYLVAHLGEDRVLYGSDLPMRDPRPQLGWVVYAQLPLQAKRKVLGLNAKRIIGGIRQVNGIAAPMTTV